MSSEPIYAGLPNDWSYAELYRRVKEALYALPNYFRTSTHIEGISATDIFTLNTVLGATIENQVVATLNQMRAVWDPNEEYLLYSFVRQSQTFPDVLLKRSGIAEQDIILGIELKGWYVLAKEAEPSFRFKVTPAACAPQDLIVVVPWALSNVISGSPQVFQPYVESAEYAARYRNHYWQHKRQTGGDTSIINPANIAPYPKKSDHIADKPASDSGGNFGRFARTGIMDSYLAQIKEIPLCGIPAQYWLDFFSVFGDQKTPEKIRQEIARLGGRITPVTDEASPVEVILQQLSRLLDVQENG